MITTERLIRLRNNLDEDNKKHNVPIKHTYLTYEQVIWLIDKLIKESEEMDKVFEEERMTGNELIDIIVRKMQSFRIAQKYIDNADADTRYAYEKANDRLDDCLEIVENCRELTLNYVEWRNVKDVLPTKEGKYYCKVAYTVVAEGQDKDGLLEIKSVKGYGYELCEFKNKWHMDNWVWEGCFSRKVVAWAEIPTTDIGI